MGSLVDVNKSADQWSICVSMELSLPGDVDRVLRGKAEKALPKTDDPSREDR
jgi:hypothetical protein